MSSRFGILLVAFSAIGFQLCLMPAGGQEAAEGKSNPGHLRMALINPKLRTTATPERVRNEENLEANVGRHLLFIDGAAAAGAEFVGFPELSVNGYEFSPNLIWLRLDGPEVKRLSERARERSVYLAIGIAEKDDSGKCWNSHVLIGPDGKLIGTHHKIWLTKEKGFVEAGTEHKVFEVKGAKLGIVTCADGSDRQNLQALVDAGARILYGPHANTTGGTSAGWYKFRAAWAGPEGWIAQLKVHAALHNHAGLYGPEFDPPRKDDDNNLGWASGAWFIGPDGQTLAQTPPSTQRSDSRESMLIYNVPL